MNATTEKPILFSGEMVRAILDGRKTQTRRVVKPQPTQTNSCGVAFYGDGLPVDYRHCPHGQPGTLLWVREAWQVDAPCDGTWCHASFYGCKESPISDVPERFRKPEHCLYRATWDGGQLLWRPSIHMPRWASRITLEVAAVRVERLQEITEEDAKAEGTDEDKFAVHYYCDEGDPDDPNDFGTHRCNWRFGFKMLWESIYGPESWDTNPWVWVIEFRRIER